MKHLLLIVGFLLVTVEAKADNFCQMLYQYSKEYSTKITSIRAFEKEVERIESMKDDMEKDARNSALSYALHANMSGLYYGNWPDRVYEHCLLSEEDGNG